MKKRGKKINLTAIVDGGGCPVIDSRPCRPCNKPSPEIAPLKVDGGSVEEKAL